MRVDPRERTTRRERFGRDATMRASNCIPADELGAMRDGKLTEARLLAISAHLGECAACREFYARIGPRVDDPERIGRYLVQSRLGTGGMGVVYEAVDPNLDRRVAIKVVRPELLDDGARRRLLREAKALARISHPNVVTVHDVGEHDQQVFVATEFVAGETMATWQIGRDWRALIEAWIQVARGLSAAHAGGIVHRDVKPSNVFVGRDGRVRIGDFGIARSHDGDSAEPSAASVAGLGGVTVTVTGAVAGTPGYMAPEQHSGEVDARSDQFSLCVSIIEGLTGRRPDAGATPLLPEVPDPVRDALIRGLAPDPASRFATMAELADALADALQQPVAPRPRPTTEPWQPEPARLRRSGSKIAVMIALAGVVTAVVVVVAMNMRTEPPSPVAASAARDVAAVPAEPRVADQVASPPAAEPVARVPEAAPSSAPSSPSDAPQPPDASHRRPPPRPATVRRPITAADDKDDKDDKDAKNAPALAKQARALENARKWEEARAAYQQLEKFKPYRSEALYGQAWAAFQMNDARMTEQLAGQLATEGGPFKVKAMFLYADALFVQSQYSRAKVIYQKLRSELHGEMRAIAQKKIVACNKELGLPEESGID